MPEVMPGKWGIHYGVLADKIAVQLHSQGIKLSVTSCDVYEKDREAINRLRLRGILSDKKSDVAFARLHDRITKEVNKYLKEKK